MKKYIAIVLFSLGLVSCKKFLAERSQSDVIPKTTRDFGEILYTNGYPTSGKLLQPYLALMDDDIQCYNSEVLTSADYIVHNSGAYMWQPNLIEYTRASGNSDAETFNSWETYYSMILGTNIALQYMDGSEGSESDKMMYKGEAYALRAFYHFSLVNLYGKPYNDSATTPDKSLGVPIMTSANLYETLPERKSVKEVYDQVTSDLDSALYFLDQVQAGQRLFRISSAATHLLASRVYLYMEQWDKAIEHANRVISRHPQLMDLNTWGAPDPITKVIIGNGNTETLWYYGSLEEAFPFGVSTAYDVSPSLAACFEPGDLRSSIFWYVTPEFLKMFTPCDYSYIKLYNQSPLSPNLGSSFRTAEAYLNRAEAYIQLYRTTGDVNAAAQALADLNTLRASRIATDSFVNWEIQPGDILLDMCRTERRRELFRESGHRWFDLRRYGMPAIEHEYRPDLVNVFRYKLEARDPQYVLAIPNDVLTRNVQLVQNPQLTNDRQPQ